MLSILYLPNSLLETLFFLEKVLNFGELTTQVVPIMNRRKALKRIGAAGAAALIAGTASASADEVEVGSDGDVRVQFASGDVVTLGDDCICDDCTHCDCPPECDACLC